MPDLPTRLAEGRSDQADGLHVTPADREAANGMLAALWAPMTDLVGERVAEHFAHHRVRSVDAQAALDASAADVAPLVATLRAVLFSGVSLPLPLSKQVNEALTQWEADNGRD